MSLRSVSVSISAHGIASLPTGSCWVSEVANIGQQNKMQTQGKSIAGGKWEIMPKVHDFMKSMKVMLENYFNRT